MKKANISLKKVIVTVLLFPVIVLFLFCFLIYGIFKFFTYKRTRYYKDTGEKFSLVYVFLPHVKFYDAVKKENLPIDYYRFDDLSRTGYGYFVYKDTLILCDAQDCCYDNERNTWLLENDDEYVDIKGEVEVAINNCNDLLKKDVCKKAVVLIGKDLFEEHPDVECENIVFLPANGYRDVDSIKMYINNDNS